jgi:hypothetical protein
MKWLIDTNRFVTHKGYFMIIPCISVWYEKQRFLESGVKTPAFGLQIGWIKYTYTLIIQKGY